MTALQHVTLNRSTVAKWHSLEFFSHSTYLPHCTLYISPTLERIKFRQSAFFENQKNIFCVLFVIISSTVLLILFSAVSSIFSAQSGRTQNSFSISVLWVIGHILLKDFYPARKWQSIIHILVESRFSNISGGIIRLSRTSLNPIPALVRNFCDLFHLRTRCLCHVEWLHCSLYSSSNVSSHWLFGGVTGNKRLWLENKFYSFSLLLVCYSKPNSFVIENIMMWRIWHSEFCCGIQGCSPKRKSQGMERSGGWTGHYIFVKIIYHDYKYNP